MSTSHEIGNIISRLIFIPRCRIIDCFVIINSSAVCDVDFNIACTTRPQTATKSKRFVFFYNSIIELKRGFFFYIDTTAKSNITIGFIINNFTA